MFPPPLSPLSVLFSSFFTFLVKINCMSSLSLSVYLSVSITALPPCEYIYSPPFIPVDIKKGDVISLSYCQPLQSTLQRRIYLRQSKCFDCMCQRCRDPSECGTYIGSLLCTSCKSGKLLPDHPFDVASNWNCENCSFQMSATNYQYFQKRLQFAIENLEKHSPYDYEMLLEKYLYHQPMQSDGATSNDTDDNIVTSDVLLHEQNTFALQIKYALTQLYGNVSGFLWNGTVCHAFNLQLRS